ncbi:phosphonate metabolism transcriptional regulator PhnF [uncultured Cohaesibacter sp.]|uniref:phosphonate metabolism transcriptional regulator PhnF n=1 Tax=uncultured Cohaesibacter sp. TaxID=1002546 RepID=UPI00292D327B|nr:phosphonate metabolism transcriptional regulator PhnF [uncultured Cohaesibacter sp.]
MTNSNWKSVYTVLSEEIENGLLKPGTRIPTEPELVARFGTGRHSVRKAVDELARQGKLSVEQGRGTFVQSEPMIAYALGRRTRLRQNLAEQATRVSGELLHAGQMEATDRIAKELGLQEGDSVVMARRVTLADDLPIGVGEAYRCAKRFPDFTERRNELGSTTKTYQSYGINDYLRAHSTIHSRLPRGDEAKILQQHPQMPVMVVRALDTMLDGSPLCYKEVVWSAMRVRFTITDEE